MKMAGFENNPRQSEDEHPDTISRNSKHGLVLFWIYCIFYAGFMGLNAFYPKVMASLMPGGINTALWYGMGLIAVALVLACIYMVLCASTGLPTEGSKTRDSGPRN